MTNCGPTLLRRLFLLMVIALAPSLLMQTYNQVHMYRQDVADVERSVLQSAIQVATEQDQVTEAVHQLLGAVASLEAVQNQDADACNARLVSLIRQYPNYAFIGVVDRDGVRFCSSGAPFPGRASLADHSFFKLSRAGHDFVVGDYGVSLVDKIAILEYGSPYLDAAGRLKGVVYTGLKLTGISDRLSLHPLPAGGEIIITDRNGTVLGGRPEADWVGKKLPQAHLDLLDATRAGRADLAGLDGVRRLFGYVPVAAPPGEGIYVAYGIDQHVALAKARSAIVRGAAAGHVPGDGVGGR